MLLYTNRDLKDRVDKRKAMEGAEIDEFSNFTLENQSRQMAKGWTGLQQ